MTTDEVAPPDVVPGLRVSSGTYVGTAVFHIQGDLDAATAPWLTAELAVAIGEEAVLLDLTGVSVIDSVGLRVLQGAILRINDHGGRVAMASTRPAMARFLRAAGLDHLAFLTDSPLEGFGWLNDGEAHLLNGNGRAHHEVPLRNRTGLRRLRSPSDP